MKTFLIIVLVIVVAAVFINDVGHYATTRYKLSQATDNIVQDLSTYGQNRTRDESALRAAELARQEGIEVYQYDQDGTGIRVWTRAAVTGTWVVGPFRAWRADKPQSTPIILEGYGTSVFQ